MRMVPSNVAMKFGCSCDHTTCHTLRRKPLTSCWTSPVCGVFGQGGRSGERHETTNARARFTSAQLQTRRGVKDAHSAVSAACGQRVFADGRPGDRPDMAAAANELAQLRAGGHLHHAHRKAVGAKRQLRRGEKGRYSVSGLLFREVFIPKPTWSLRCGDHASAAAVVARPQGNSWTLVRDSTANTDTFWWGRPRRTISPLSAMWLASRDHAMLSVGRSLLVCSVGRIAENVSQMQGGVCL